MSSTQIIKRDPAESYPDFAVRVGLFMDNIYEVLSDMSQVDRVIVEDTGTVNGGRQVILTIVKNANDDEGLDTRI